MEFDDIRPYTDEEFREAKERILKGPEFNGLMYVLSNAYFQGKSKRNDLIQLQRTISEQLAHVNTVEEFQDIIDGLAWRLVAETTSCLEYSGLENVVTPDNRGVLFISNHRDIASDFLFTNLILHKNSYERVMCAAGSNLLVSPLIGDLLKSYNCFIVKRGSSMRQRPREMRELSRYIAQQIANGHSIWLAQREGRAKDGDDVTNPALIRMLYSAQEMDGGIPFSEYINSLNIIPLSVSYQYDPCDVLKARELHERKSDPEYRKSGFVDKMSMFVGISGAKGGVHITFGESLRDGFSSPKEAATFIDEKIQGQYRIWDTNEIAYRELHEDALDDVPRYPDDVRSAFLTRFKDCSPDELKIVLSMYAQPLENQLKLAQRP
jgi:hypothetical protein